MTDVFTKEKRSWVMSRIRSRNTKLENELAEMLKKHRVKFRRYPKIIGNPDFLIGKKTIVFIDGCFWHKCPKHYKDPKSKKNLGFLKLRRT